MRRHASRGPRNGGDRRAGTMDYFPFSFEFESPKIVRSKPLIRTMAKTPMTTPFISNAHAKKKIIAIAAEQPIWGGFFLVCSDSFSGALRSSDAVFWGAKGFRLFAVGGCSRGLPVFGSKRGLSGGCSRGRPVFGSKRGLSGGSGAFPEAVATSLRLGRAAGAAGGGEDNGFCR